MFARAPELGVVKSRLARTLGDTEALEVYRAMIRDLLSRFEQVTEIDVEVLWTGTESVPGEALIETFRPHRLARQVGRDLGERMTMAFSERALLQRTSQIIAIGTDVPDLEPSDLESAFALLDSCDWVVGPATDGGYYLIGCRASSFDGRVFEGIHWGQSSVLEATLDRIRELGETVAMLPERTDIDLEEDLLDYVRRRPGGEVARTCERVLGSLGRRS